MSFLVSAAVKSNYLGDFSGKRQEQRRSSLSRVHQDKYDEDSEDYVPSRPRRPIPEVCEICRETMSRCSGIRPCDRCQRLGLECGPKTTPADVAATEQLQEPGTESKLEQVDIMMSDLELEGWHLVSREEVEESVQS